MAEATFEHAARDFDGRRVVVTGGTGSLGTGVVSALLDRGAECHIPALEDDEIARFALADHDRVSLVTGVDLAKEEEVQKFYRHVAARGQLWASVHCAGGFEMSPIEETGEGDFQRMMRTNAQTCFLACREAVGAVRKGTGGGRIVNVAARPGCSPDQGANMTAYAASKAAVAAITEALAAEVASEGIWVNAVVPSIMDTRQNREAMPEADHGAWPSVDEVASTICFLASPVNRATRGALVPVYGRC